MCPSAEDGTLLPCPEGYGALCALLEIGLSFMAPSLLKKLFPPIVTAPTVTLIGVALIQTGLEGWAGSSGSWYVVLEPSFLSSSNYFLSMSRPTAGDYMLCPSNSAPHVLAWGSTEFIGLGLPSSSRSFSTSGSALLL